MATIRKAVQQIGRGGVAPAYTGSLTTSDDYAVSNDGRTVLHFLKTGAGACTVTIETPAKVSGLDLEEQEITVPATSGDIMAGPFPPSVFNAGGDLSITFSNVTGLTFAALRL